MNYPKIRFVVDRNKDLEAFKVLWRDTFLLSDIREKAFYNLYPELKILEKKSKEEREELIEKFVKDFYKTHANEIKKGTKETEKRWRKVESKYFKLVDKIFPNYPWPKGKYIAYTSIWNMFPYNRKDKFFQFPYKHKKPNFALTVIAHEMLHFIFYDYVEQKLGQKERIDGKFNMKLWNLAESFNYIIMSSKPWVSVFKIKTLPYPQHEKLVPKLIKIEKESKNIDEFLEKALKIQ